MTTNNTHHTASTSEKPSTNKRTLNTSLSNEIIDDLGDIYYFNRNDTVFVDNSDKLTDDAFDNEKGCSDFVCCNTHLPDLHSLLKHYEEEHVIVEVFEESNHHSMDPPTNTSSNTISPSFSKNNDLTRVVHMGYAPPDSTDSAFDTSIFRAVTPVGSNYHGTTCYHQSYSPPRKRPNSMVSFSSFSSYSEYNGNGGSTGKTDHFSNDPSLECALKMLQSFAKMEGNSSRDSIGAGGSNGAMDQASWKLIQNALSNTLPLSLTSSSASLFSQNNSSNDLEMAGGGGGGFNGGSCSGVFCEEDRPFVCRIEGCLKTYKNANGLKYHMRHGHHDENSYEDPLPTLTPNIKSTPISPSSSMSSSMSTPPIPTSPQSTTKSRQHSSHESTSSNNSSDLLVEKPHRCPQANCGKRYKNANGLKYHILHGHSNPQTNAPNGTISFVPNQNNRMVLHGHHGISFEDSYLDHGQQRQERQQQSQEQKIQQTQPPTINRKVNSNTLEAIEKALNREKAIRLQNK